MNELACRDYPIQHFKTYIHKAPGASLIACTILSLSGFFCLHLLTCGFSHVAEVSCISTVVVVVLLFYVHGKYLKSCRDGQLT